MYKLLLLCLLALLPLQAFAVVDLPSPDWSAPASAPTAPGDTFGVTFSGRTAVANSPVIAEWTKTALPNESFTLTGTRFTRLAGSQAGSDTTVWLWADNGSGGTLRQCKLWKVWDDNVLTATVPSDVPFGMYLVWVENNAGASIPVAINKPSAEWIGPLGSTVVTGQSIRVFGKNVSNAHGTTTSYVYVQPTGGGSFTSCTVTNVEPEAITFTVPSVSAGTYNVFVHSGHGGQYGWSQADTLTVGSAWTRGTGTQIVNPGGGNDATAIQAAIDTVSGYANGGTVQLSAGTFNCSSNVSLKNNVKLLGAGQGSTIIQFSAGEMNFLAGAGHVALQGFTAQPASGYALSIHSEAVHGGARNTDMTVSNCSFAVNTDTASSIGFYLEVQRLEVSSCTFQGMLCGDGSDWWLHNNTLYGGRNDLDGGLAFAQTPNIPHGNFVVETNSASTQNWPNNGGNRNYKEFLTAVQISALVWNSRLLYYQMGCDSYENSYIGHNTTTDVAIQDNKGESILFHSAETSAYAQVASNVGRTLTIRTDGTIDGIAGFSLINGGANTVYPMTSIPASIGFGNGPIDNAAYVLIVSGTGIGQINKLASHTSTTLTVANDWRVQPDSTSKIMMNYIYRNHIQYANTLNGFPVGYTNADGYTASCGVDYDGGCFGNVSENNSCTRTGAGNQLQGYILAPSFFNEMRGCSNYTTVDGGGECLNARQGCPWWAASANDISPFVIGCMFRGGHSDGKVQSSSVSESYTANYPHLIGNAIEGMTINRAGDGYYSGNMDWTLFRNNSVTLTGSGNSVVLEKNSEVMLDGNTYSGGSARYYWTASPGIKINTGDTGDGSINGFLIDQDYTGGYTASEPGTPDLSIDPLPNIWIIKYYRYGSSFSYTIPGLYANNSYKVRLHFVEPTCTGAGQRVFNVTGNGTTLASNYDIWAEVGKDKAVYHDSNVVSNGSGQIVLQFTGVTSNAVVSAIEIWDNCQWMEMPNPVLHVAQFAGTVGVAASPVDINMSDLGIANTTWSVSSTSPSWVTANVQSGGTVAPETETGDLRVNIDTSSMSAGYNYGTVTLTTALGRTFYVGVEANLAAQSQVAAPSFSPVAGNYTDSQNVTITTTTSGASIRYTTDGTTPTSTIGNVYSSAVSVSQNLTLKAIAYKSGMTDSTVTSGSYTINCVAPTFNPVAGAYGTAQSVTITSATNGASIRYTTDGTTPSDTVGTVYSAAVPIPQNLTLKAVAYKTNMANSTVTSGAYSFFIGNNTVGAANQTFTSGRMYAARFQTPANITASSILVDIATSPSSKKIKCAIYADSSGSPGSFLMGTNELTNPGTGWKTFTLTSGQALTGGTYYWLVMWANGAFAVKGDNTGGTSAWKSQTYGTWPSSFGTPGGSGTIKYSIYAQ